MKKKTIVILFSICLLLIVGPLIINKNAKFAGADNQAEQMITKIDKNYKPWFSSLWVPPSGEVESFIFAAQAAIGAGFIGFFIGKKTK